MIKKIKICRDCCLPKKRNEFTINSSKILKNGEHTRRPNCRECYNIEMLKKYYSDKKYQAMVKNASRRQYLRLKAAKENKHEVV